jgi:hypothetical protein
MGKTYCSQISQKRSFKRSSYGDWTKRWQSSDLRELIRDERGERAMREVRKKTKRKSHPMDVIGEIVMYIAASAFVAMVFIAVLLLYCRMAGALGIVWK